MAQQTSNGNRPKLSEKGLLTPDNCVVALIDHQPQMLFGTSNFDRQGGDKLYCSALQSCQAVWSPGRSFHRRDEEFRREPVAADPRRVPGAGTHVSGNETSELRSAEFLPPSLESLRGRFACAHGYRLLEVAAITPEFEAGRLKPSSISKRGTLADICELYAFVPGGIAGRENKTAQNRSECRTHYITALTGTLELGRARDRSVPAVPVEGQPALSSETEL
jgi:hypothetical protein